MLKTGELSKAFQPYWEDMNRCMDARAYWSLLHVTVCIPDICAALESSNGETCQQKYEGWCMKYLKNNRLPARERYRMRCKVLHQGRSTTDRPGSYKYDGFAFGQPSDSGDKDHMRVENGILHLDVGELASEMKRAAESWGRALESDPKSNSNAHVARNLPSLVHVTKAIVPVPSSGLGVMRNVVISKTN